MAFKNVCNDPLRRWAKGSRDGYFLDPHRTESDKAKIESEIGRGAQYISRKVLACCHVDEILFDENVHQGK